MKAYIQGKWQHKETKRIIEIEGCKELHGRVSVVFMKDKSRCIKPLKVFLEEYEPLDRNNQTHIMVNKFFKWLIDGENGIYEQRYVQIRGLTAHISKGFYKDAQELASKEPEFWNMCPTFPIEETRRRRK